MTDPTLESIARSQDRTLLIVEQLAEKVEDRIEHTDAWRERTDLILMGDGNGRKGHNVRIDRLEQSLKAQLWVIRVLGTGIIVLVLNAVREML